MWKSDSEDDGETDYSAVINRHFRHFCSKHAARVGGTRGFDTMVGRTTDGAILDPSTGINGFLRGLVDYPV